MRISEGGRLILLLGRIGDVWRLGFFGLERRHIGYEDLEQLVLQPIQRLLVELATSSTAHASWIEWFCRVCRPRQGQSDR